MPVGPQAAANGAAGGQEKWPAGPHAERAAQATRAREEGASSGGLNCSQLKKYYNS
jgi:hypothetical protein